jgi:hypothetical protein
MSVCGYPLRSDNWAQTLHVHMSGFYRVIIFSDNTCDTQSNLQENAHMNLNMFSGVWSNRTQHPAPVKVKGMCILTYGFDFDVVGGSSQ